MVWHPSKYAELLAKRIQQNGTSVWLVNTGWSGGGFGEGKRMSLKYTRSIIDSILDGTMKNAPTVHNDLFGFDVPTECPKVPDEILKLERDIVERVIGEVLDKPGTVSWDSIVGLEHAKNAVQELAVWPMTNPELFTGARVSHDANGNSVKRIARLACSEYKGVVLTGDIQCNARKLTTGRN